jgi:diguanylate cyclase (GGDEF)-like protein/PAS domain S-box-containing protein
MAAMSSKKSSARSSSASGSTPIPEPDKDSYQAIVEEAPCCLMKVRVDGTIVFINRYALEFLDRDPSSLIGKPLHGALIAAGDEMDPPLAWIQAEMADNPHAILTFETKIQRPNGDRVWLAWSTRSLFDENGVLVEFLSAGADISERKTLETELMRLAITDPLTGAYNRRYLVDAGAREAERARRYGSPFSILVIDIDFFKNVNDTYGHSVGDATLQALTVLCRKMLRGSDCFGRMGGEEFAVLLPQADLGRAHALADRMRLAVAKMPIDSPKGPIFITISIGVAQLSGPETRFDETLIRADKALYQAKQTGRNRVISNPNLEKPAD